ncbi:MAG: hypothetical protein JW723_07385 [Bacteroidales bacterium]|nr:hypothetical protein [Bacteroidales bacterium]
MKNIRCFMILTPVLILLFVSCSKEDNEDAGFINIDGKKYVLTYGLFDDAGLDAGNTYRNFWLRFQSTEGDQPAHFIVFKLYSYSTSVIEEGTYNYDYIQTGAGLFSWVKVGYDLQYDEEGKPDGGTVLTDKQVTGGSMAVTTEGEICRFEFTIGFEVNDTPVNVSGEFKDVLDKGDVSYSDIKK